MFCDNCGNQISEDLAFCSNCGNQIASPPPPPPPPPGAFAPPPPPQTPPPPPTDNPYASPLSANNPYATSTPPTPGYPPAGEPYVQPPKKSSSTIPIVIACGVAFVLIFAAVLIYVNRETIFGSGTSTVTPTNAITVTPAPATPTPTPSVDEPTPTPATSEDDATPPPETLQPQDEQGAELEGHWRNGTGDYIWFFAEADSIQFTFSGSGIGRVYEDDYGEWADWWISSDGLLCIDGEVTGHGYRELTYIVIGNTLTLIDEDGDIRTFTR